VIAVSRPCLPARQLPQLADLVRGDPRLGQPAHPQQVSQIGRVTLVVFDPAVAERLDPERVRQVHLGARSRQRAGLASPSLEGGLEEFRGDCASRVSSSAIRRARASSACVPANSARSKATSAASTSSCGASRSAGTPGPYYRPRSLAGSLMLVGTVSSR
jgi:hypothetical protein